MKHICITAFVVLSVYLRCTELQIAGVTETGNNVVTGRIVDSTGTPFVGAIVKLYPNDYNPFYQTSGLVKTDTTGPAGSYSFSNVDTGGYCIHAASKSNHVKAMIAPVQISDDTLTVLDGVLRTPGTIRIPVSATFDSLGSYLFIPGSNYAILISERTNGYLILDSVPAGTLPLLCIGTDNNPMATPVRYEVKILPGDTVTISYPDWRYAATIHINTSGSGTGIANEVYDFPLLVTLTTNNFNFTTAAPGGEDVRCAKLDDTPLPFEIERWDAVAHRAEIWIRMDTLPTNNSDRQIRLYWGNARNYSSSNGTLVFDTALGYTGVWHCNENPAAGAGAIKDRTANGHHGTANGSMTSGNVVSGMIGTALRFNGTDDYINAGILNLSGNYTMSCWINADDLNTARRFIWKEYSYTLWYDAKGGGIRVEHFTYNDSVAVWRGIYQDNSRLVPLAINTWYYLAGTYDGDKIRLFINGKLVDSTKTIGLPPVWSDQPLSLGGRSQEYVKGTMDEIRIEKTARSTEWINLSYENQKPGSAMASIER